MAFSIRKLKTWCGETISRNDPWDPCGHTVSILFYQNTTMTCLQFEGHSKGILVPTAWPFDLKIKGMVKIYGGLLLDFSYEKSFRYIGRFCIGTFDAIFEGIHFGSTATAIDRC